MERTLVLSAFAVGWLGWLFGMLGAGSRRDASAPSRSGVPRSTLIVCLLLPLLVFLATLPTHPPFAPGQGFGRGFVIGALGALLAGWLLFRAADDTAEETESLPAAAVATGPYFMAVAAVAAPVMWMHAVLTDALLGVAIGWFSNTFLLTIVPSQRETPQLARVVASTIGAGFAVTLAIAVALGDYGGVVRLGAAPLPVSWRAIVLVFGACVPFLMLCCALPAAWLAALFSRLPLSGAFMRFGGALIRSDKARSTLARTWRLLPAAALLLCAARLFSSRLEHHPPLVALTGIGLASCLIAWWLMAGTDDATNWSAQTQGTARQNAALSVIVILCAAMAAYQMFAGVGIGIVLLAAWLIAGLALHAGRTGTPAGANQGIAPEPLQSLVALPALLIFGLLVEIYRFLLVRFENDLHGVMLSDHYALFGFVLGAVLPMLVAGYLIKPHQRNMDLPEYDLSNSDLYRQMTAGERIGRTLVAGVLVLAAPFTLLLLFGAKCALALCFGLALGAILPLLQGTDPAATGSGSNRQAALAALLPSLLALATGLALAQWTHHVIPMALYARAEKLHLLSYLVLAGIVLVLASDYYGRYRDGRFLRQSKSSQGDGMRRAAQ